MQNTEVPASRQVVTPLSEVMAGAELSLGIAAFAATQPGGIEAWLNRPMRDGHGRIVTVDTTPVVDADELVSF